MKAFALDYLIISGYLSGLTLLFLLLNSITNAFQLLFSQRVQARVLAFLLVTFPVTLYISITGSSARQAPRGKQRLDLRVTDPEGNFSSGANLAVIHYGFVLVYFLVGLNIVSLLLTKTHRTLYDFLAGTYVVKNTL